MPEVVDRSGWDTTGTAGVAGRGVGRGVVRGVARGRVLVGRRVLWAKILSGSTSENKMNRKKISRILMVLWENVVNEKIVTGITPENKQLFLVIWVVE